VRKGTDSFLEESHTPGHFPMIRIIGVDPGIAVTGFGVIDFSKGHSIQYCSSGVFRSRRWQTFPQTIQQIFHGLIQQIEKFEPHFMAIERPFYAKNVKSAMLLGQARGVAILAAAEAGVEVQEYSPLEVKQAVVGYGRAGKEQVQSMIRVLLHLSQSLTPDAADALAVALCLAHSLPWQTSLKNAEPRKPLKKRVCTPPKYLTDLRGYK
jgi:crossover junction endodeoxyribonuclease RuvC